MRRIASLLNMGNRNYQSTSTLKINLRRGIGAPIPRSGLVHSAFADGHARLGSINFERQLLGRQFEKLTEYNVPLAECDDCC